MPVAPFEVIDWGLTPYPEAMERQLELVAQRLAGKIGDTLVLVEHPAVYTIGTREGSQKHLTASEEFLKRYNIAVEPTNRGGDITLHAPGQLVIYPIFKLEHRDLHKHLRLVEEGIIRALGYLGLSSQRVPEKTGVWVCDKASARKIAAIGVAVRQWVSYHGAALNVCNDLRLFEGIVPCGLVGSAVTSVREELKENTPTMTEVKKIVEASFAEVFAKA